MKINIVDTNGKENGRSIELPESLFGVEPNEHVMYLAVKQYLANQRQGTNSSRDRGEIRGSTRKIKRQKGTGTARAGSIKSPVFRGGGRIFGPKPRDYSIKLNKKVKSLARASALSSKLKSDSIIVIEDFSFDQPKTKEYKNILINLGISDKKVLHLVSEQDNTLVLSNRNLQKSHIQEVRQLNTYEILNAEKLVFFESAIEKIKEIF